MWKTKNDPPKRRKGVSESKRADAMLGNFDAKKSRGYQFILGILSEPISLSSLISLATIISFLSGIPFSRDYTRRKDLVIKWFDDNYDDIFPFKDKIHANYETLQK